MLQILCKSQNAPAVGPVIGGAELVKQPGKLLCRPAVVVKIAAGESCQTDQNNESPSEYQQRRAKKRRCQTDKKQTVRIFQRQLKGGKQAASGAQGGDEAEEPGDSGGEQAFMLHGAHLRYDTARRRHNPAPADPPPPLRCCRAMSPEHFAGPVRPQRQRSRCLPR